MENSNLKISQLLNIIYLIIGLFILNLTTTIILYFNPINKVVDVETEKQWNLNSINDIPENNLGKNIKYGYQLITNTNKLLGPLAKNPSMRFAGNNLNCTNCHLDAGRKIGAGSFVGISNRFPQFRARENKIGKLADRINGCFERSMNGRVMDSNSKEMQAIVDYMNWLSKDVPKEIEKKYKGYVKIEIPFKKADVNKGKTLYDIKCMACHQEKGIGMKKPGGEFNGYVYPPLGGNDSYNDGAGMNRVITAAEFIKGNMPLGATYDSPQVSDEEAYNIAAYINTFARPEKKNKKADFPNIKLKPVSTPYGPWADHFPPEQHKFGPFQPIFIYYKSTYNITKSK
mgnify:CR=1 FL=1